MLTAENFQKNTTKIGNLWNEITVQTTHRNRRILEHSILYNQNHPNIVPSLIPFLVLVLVLVSIHVVLPLLLLLLSTCRYVGNIKSFHLKLKIKTSIVVVFAINRNFTLYYLLKRISAGDILWIYFVGILWFLWDKSLSCYWFRFQFEWSRAI